MTLVGACAFAIGGFRFFWSWLIDHYSFKFSYTIILVMQILLCFTFEYVKEYKVGFFIWVCLLIWTEGGHFTNLPTVCSKIFGDQAAMVYGIAFSFCGLTNLLAIILIKFTLKHLGFAFFFYLSGGFNVLALILLLVFFKE